MTHGELIERAKNWLRIKRCTVILSEIISGSNLEIPDAIGWQHHASMSYLIECKVSRTDFHRDKKKVFRRPGAAFALGRYRYYMAPPKMLSPDEMPARWGLLEVYPKTVKIKKKAEPHGTSNYSAVREMNVMAAELGMIQRMMRGEEMISSGHVRNIIQGMHKAIEVNG